MSKPTFALLQPVRNPVAGERNPHRDGWYLRKFRRTGRLNPGLWAVVLHEDGEESETPFDSLVPLPGRPLPALCEYVRLLEKVAEAGAALAEHKCECGWVAFAVGEWTAFCAALAALPPLDEGGHPMTPADRARWQTPEGQAAIRGSLERWRGYVAELERGEK